MIKNYLSRAERDNYLLCTEIIMHVENVMNQWGNSLTTDERKRLKSSITNIQKALVSIANRLPNHEVKKIMKAAEDFQVRILSVEGAKALEKSSKKEYLNNIKISFEEMEAIVTQILTNNCYYCKLKCNDCDYYPMLERFLVPGCNAETNCPYAFNEFSKIKVAYSDDMENVKIYRECLKRQKVKNEIKQEIEKDKLKRMNMQSKINKKEAKTDHKVVSKRKQKKIENRYDDDEIL